MKISAIKSLNTLVTVVPRKAFQLNNLLILCIIEIQASPKQMSNKGCVLNIRILSEVSRLNDDMYNGTVRKGATATYKCYIQIFIVQFMI